MLGRQRIPVNVTALDGLWRAGGTAGCPADEVAPRGCRVTHGTVAHQVVKEWVIDGRNEVVTRWIPKKWLDICHRTDAACR